MSEKPSAAWTAFEALWPTLRPAQRGQPSPCGFPWSAARNLTRGVAEYIFQAGWTEAGRAGAADPPADPSPGPPAGSALEPELAVQLEATVEMLEALGHSPDALASESPAGLIGLLFEELEKATRKPAKRPAKGKSRLLVCAVHKQLDQDRERQGWLDRERLEGRIHEAEIQLGWDREQTLDRARHRLGCVWNQEPVAPAWSGFRHYDEADLVQLAEDMEALAAKAESGQVQGPAPGAPAETAQDPSEPPTAKAAADSPPSGPRSCEICQEPLMDPGRVHKRCARKAIKSRHRPTSRQWAALESIRGATGQPHPAVVADLIGLGFVQRLESGEPRLTPRGETLLRYRTELESR